MSSQEQEFASEVCDALVDISRGECGITEEQILHEPNENRAVVLSGLLMLHEDLAYHSGKRVAAESRAEAALDELRRLNSRLSTARDRAEAATRAKADFLANMSHEIRTPLNAVIGMTEILAQSRLTVAQREMAATISSSGDALLALVNDILDLSKINAGHLELESAAFDLRRCVEETIMRASGSVQVKNLELTYHVQDEVPEAIMGDSARLGQILLNLLANAIKFTKKGEVSLVVSATEKCEDRVALSFTVRDTGIGIPANKIHTVFESFTQVDASTTRTYGGTGLGLTIVKRLVDKLNGSIKCESTEGVGSTFRVTFVVERTNCPPSSSEVFASLVGKSVLIVDDIETNRRLLAQGAKRWGMIPTLVESAEEALAVLGLSSVFHLVILDMQMPGMNGIQLARRINSDPKYAHLPLILLTSVSIPDKHDQLDGIHKRLTKPVRRSALFNALLSALQVPAAKAKRPTPLATMKAVPTWPLRILLAEDNMMNRRVALAMLESLGYVADVAHNGEQVLAVTRTKSYDVILMDVQMPKLDGLGATRALIDRPHPTPYIVAMTANALDSDRAICLAAGMHDYISKPVRMKTLRAVLERCARHSHVAPIDLLRDKP